MVSPPLLQKQNAFCYYTYDDEYIDDIYNEAFIGDEVNTNELVYRCVSNVLEEEEVIHKSLEKYSLAVPVITRAKTI
jgi:hypothetical protein